jgi:hypothetical protein
MNKVHELLKYEAVFYFIFLYNKVMSNLYLFISF